MYGGVCLFCGNGLNFDQYTHRKILNSEGSACRAVFGVVFGVHFVHGFEVGDITQQTGRLDHIVESVSGFLQYGFHIPQKAKMSTPWMPVATSSFWSSFLFVSFFGSFFSELNSLQASTSIISLFKISLPKSYLVIFIKEFRFFFSDCIDKL